MAEILFFFAEAFGYSRKEVLELPISARKALIEKKQELEDRKAKRQQAAASRARAKARRGR